MRSGGPRCNPKLASDETRGEARTEYARTICVTLIFIKKSVQLAKFECGRHARARAAAFEHCGRDSGGERSGRKNYDDKQLREMLSLNISSFWTHDFDS